MKSAALLAVLTASAEALRVGTSAVVRPLPSISGTARTLTPRMQEPGGEFKVGAKVRISGLNSNPELNGKVGTVEEFDGASGRYAVNGPSGTVLLKPSALELTWNTALDADGKTYYWRGGESQYEMPEGFDPAVAKSAGVYQAKSTDLYDDEIGEGPITYSDGTKKAELSSTMRDKLINESRGLGADPNQKNPFLPVFFGVGVFVILGALAVNL